MNRLLDVRFTVALGALAMAICLNCEKDDNVIDPGNQPPVITSLTADPDTFYMGNSTTVTVIANDPDGDSLNYDWETHGLDLLPISGESNTIELTTCCPVFEPATATVLSIVDDGRGGEDRDSIQVWILPLP
jgi:hypothetical protein